MTEKKYGDKSLLEAIPNRITLDKDLLITHTANELTFIGSPDQPDFGQLTILTTPGPGGLIELKSLKKYLQSFRECHISYERLAAVIYTDLTEKYRPKTLKLIVRFNVRGGIESEVVIDSEK